jgi:hypothetical protein
MKIERKVELKWNRMMEEWRIEGWSRENRDRWCEMMMN